MQRISKDFTEASQTELISFVDKEVPEQDVPKNINNNDMTSQRVQYYQCPCCKCGNTHYQQLVSGSIPGSGYPASMVYDVPQRLSTTAETEVQYRKPSIQSGNGTRRYSNLTPLPEPQKKRNGLDEDDPPLYCPDEQECINARNYSTQRSPPPRQLQQLQQQQLQQQQLQQQQLQQQQHLQQQKPNYCCVCCGRPIKPFRDNGTVTGSDISKKLCLETCTLPCKSKTRMQVDEEIMVVPTYDTKEVTVTPPKAKRETGTGPQPDFRNCERCCGRSETKYERRYDERREIVCECKNCGAPSVGKCYKREEECFCEPTCDPASPVCGTCKVSTSEMDPRNKESTNTMASQGSHVRTHHCHLDPMCSLCQIELNEKQRPVLVDQGVNTMPVKKRCSLFDKKSKK